MSCCFLAILAGSGRWRRETVDFGQLAPVLLQRVCTHLGATEGYLLQTVYCALLDKKWNLQFAYLFANGPLDGQRANLGIAVDYGNQHDATSHSLPVFILISCDCSTCASARSEVFFCSLSCQISFLRTFVEVHLVFQSVGASNDLLVSVCTIFRYCCSPA